MKKSGILLPLALMLVTLSPKSARPQSSPIFPTEWFHAIRGEASGELPRDDVTIEGYLGDGETFFWAFLTEGASVGLVDDLRGQHGTSEDKPVMFSIVTNEIDAWYQHMVAPGAQNLFELGESADAPTRAFVVEDPGGYTVEFFQWMSQESR